MSAQARMVDALLQGSGGRQVLLRIPAAAVQGDLGEQVGLAVPEFEDLELGPAVFRKARPKVGPAGVEYELLVSAAAVGRVAGAADAGSAGALFGTAAGVMVDGALLQISSVTNSEAFGVTYLYRLGLKGSAAGLV